VIGFCVVGPRRSDLETLATGNDPYFPATQVFLYFDAIHHHIEGGRTSYEVRNGSHPICFLHGMIWPLSASSSRTDLIVRESSIRKTEILEASPRPCLYRYLKTLSFRGTLRSNGSLLNAFQTFLIQPIILLSPFQVPFSRCYRQSPCRQAS